MCPIFEYRCTEEHVTEHIRSYANRDEPFQCHLCGSQVERIQISKSHIEPDGIYSYAPNVGSPARFERQQRAIRDGRKVIPKVDD